MPTLTDHRIKQLCMDVEQPMISPFIGESVSTLSDGTKVPSYGLSACGYDVRLNPHIRLYRTTKFIDRGADHYDEMTVDSIVLRPGDVVHGSSIETFNLPENILAHVYSKSTWIRKSLPVMPAPLEPGWKGEMFIALKNELNRSVELRTGVGICQVIFEELSYPVDVPYNRRNDGKGGKYQNQTGIQGSLL